MNILNIISITVLWYDCERSMLQVIINPFHDIDLPGGKERDQWHKMD